MLKRRPILFTAVAGAVIASIYGAGWLFAASVMEDAVATWVLKQREAGWTVSHGRVALEGFPLALGLRIEAPHVAWGEAAKYYAWDGPALKIFFVPWDMRRIRFSAPGAHRIQRGSADNRRLATVTAALATGRVELAPDGRALLLAATLEGVTLTPARQAGEITAGKIEINLSAPQAATPPRLEAEIVDIGLPAKPRPALGRRIEHVALTAALKGEIPAGPPSLSLGAWRDSGGVIEIERLELAWADLGVRADGTVALDRDLQPIGALTAHITGFHQAVDALVAAGAVRAKDAMTARIVLRLLARTPKGGGPETITAPISAQNRRLYIGPIRLLRLPRIDWD